MCFGEGNYNALIHYFLFILVNWEMIFFDVLRRQIRGWRRGWRFVGRRRGVIASRWWNRRGGIRGRSGRGHRESETELEGFRLL